jgi:hypothetical protein
MPIDRARAAEHLKAFAFQPLFIEELGWDRPSSRQSESVSVGGNAYALTPIAEKRGIRIFHCPVVPDRNVRQRIDREVAKLAFEHLIIFTDADRSRQVWQWVAREKGKPAAFRDYTWLVTQDPAALIQKLDHIAFSLDEEEGLTLAGTIVRMRDAFDRDRITKRFYEAFKQQHTAFLGFIQGLERASDRQWYASLTLNRLMFVYFIQKKGFLNGEIHYLRDRLSRVREELGQDRFHSFYRTFLLKLFHGGLAMPVESRDPETSRLLGNIPYLNGGLFESHALEDGHQIEIADAAFEGVFAFFDSYDWTLDTRPIGDANEINPDVLGHIFEKYINQKQMGAYYTKEDVTDYITKNTIIPWLFNYAAEHDRVAFERGGAVWRMLAENPDAYIYPSVRKGVDLPLPHDIAAGIGDASRRANWSKPATADIGLPTETWREVVARRERYETIKAKLKAGEVSSIDDVVTYNLDISQFARDVIQYAESPDLVKAFRNGVSEIKVLDPACGSGAFLFAALGVLYDLYDACLDRMQEFVDSAPPAKGPFPQFKGFRDELAKISLHRDNRDYYIYKSIIIANLYGVDIMDEAVEICKLRLFLKLAAQLEDALHIEPLPDIDFNIRAGNTLIGFTSMADVRLAAEASGFDFEDRAGQIEASAQDLDAAFKLFRKQQTELNGSITSEAKTVLRERLNSLEGRLDRFLAQEYGVRPDETAFAKWKGAYKPFHWLIEFYGIINDGGFDVVVGNPPYVKAPDVRKDYTIRGYVTDRSSDMYAWIMERAARLTSPKGFYGMIVPLSLTFSGNFQDLRDFLLDQFSTNWFSSFARIPAALFSADVRVRNTIHIGARSGPSGHHTTITHRWFEEARPYLMERIEYAKFDPSCWNGLIPKLGLQRLLTAIETAKRTHSILDAKLSNGVTRFPLHFKKSAYNWVSFGYEEPPAFAATGEPTSQTKVGQIYAPDEASRQAIHTLLNGKIAFLWWSIVGDDFDVTKKDFEYFPFPEYVDAARASNFADLSRSLHSEMNQNIVFKLNAGKRVGNYNLALCRDITDRSDQLWANHLGLASATDDIELAYVQIVKTNFDNDED